MSNTIKLDENSLKTLKSFSHINAGMLFKPGKKLEVAHKLKEIIGFCDVDVEIPSRFAIYDMTKLLGVISLHDQATLTLELDDKTMILKSKNAKTKYRTTDETNVTSIPEAFNLAIKDVNAEFHLSSEELDEIKSVSNSLALPHVVFTSGQNGMSPGEKLCVKVTDTKNDASDEHLLFPDTEAKGAFENVVFKSENLSKLMTGTGYDVVTNKKFAHFVSTDKKLQYFISLELDKK